MIDKLVGNIGKKKTFEMIMENFLKAKEELEELRKANYEEIEENKIQIDRLEGRIHHLNEENIKAFNSLEMLNKII